jgi:hypothetical protein
MGRITSRSNKPQLQNRSRLRSNAQRRGLRDARRVRRNSHQPNRRAPSARHTSSPHCLRLRAQLPPRLAGNPSKVLQLDHVPDIAGRNEAQGADHQNADACAEIPAIERDHEYDRHYYRPPRCREVGLPAIVLSRSNQNRPQENDESRQRNQPGHQLHEVANARATQQQRSQQAAEEAWNEKQPQPSMVTRTPANWLRVRQTAVGYAVTRATALVASAVTGATTSISNGNMISPPPPASALIAPATMLATKNRR